MKNREDELIAALLGDNPASAEMRQWMETETGRRETDEYRRTLGALDRFYRKTNVVSAKAVIHYCSVATPTLPVGSFESRFSSSR